MYLYFHIFICIISFFKRLFILLCRGTRNLFFFFLLFFTFIFVFFWIFRAFRQNRDILIVLLRFYSKWSLRFHKRFFRFYCSLRSLIIIIIFSFNVCRFVSLMLLTFSSIFRAALIIYMLHFPRIFIWRFFYWKLFIFITIIWNYFLIFFQNFFWKCVLLLAQMIFKSVSEIIFSSLHFNIFWNSLSPWFNRSFWISINL